MSKSSAKATSGASGKRAQHSNDALVVPARIAGPIAAWRLSLSVVVSAVATGMPLLDAATTGNHLDLALGRSFATACVVWFAAGRVNRVLVDVELRRRLDEVNAPAVADIDRPAEAAA